MTVCEVNKNSINYIKTKLGVKKNIVPKLADKALEKGIKFDDCKGSLKKHLNGVMKLYDSDDTRILNRKIYLFKNNTLKTVMDLPTDYNELVKNITK